MDPRHELAVHGRLGGQRLVLGGERDSVGVSEGTLEEPPLHPQRQP